MSSKDDKRKIKALNICINITFFGFILMSFLFFSNVYSTHKMFDDLKGNPPTVLLYKDIFDTFDDDGYRYGTLGRFSKSVNHISLTEPKAGSCHIGDLFLHEYGHYIEYNINDTERDIWRSIMPNESVALYEEDDWYDEHFADGFKNYLNGYNMTSKQFEYFNNIYEKYIKEK